MAGNCGECTRRWFCNENPETCGAFPELPPPTNADRIRSMSDEELARFLWEQNGGNRYWKSFEKYLDWLQKEVTYER